MSARRIPGPFALSSPGRWPRWLIHYRGRATVPSPLSVSATPTNLLTIDFDQHAHPRPPPPIANPAPLSFRVAMFRNARAEHSLALNNRLTITDLRRRAVYVVASHSRGDYHFRERENFPPNMRLRIKLLLFQLLL